MKDNFSYLILFLTVFVTLNSCDVSSDEAIVKTEEDHAIVISKLLNEKFASQTQLIYREDTLLAQKEVLDYYKTTDFAPIWIEKEQLNKSGEELLGLVDNAYDYGFMPAMFHSDHIHQMVDSSILDAELLLTNAFFLYKTHVTVGCIDSTNLNYVWKKEALTYELPTELNRVKQGENVTDVIINHQPQFWEYLQLQKGLTAFLDSFDLDTNHYEIPAFKKDSTACYQAANKALIGHDFMDTVTAKNDSLFIEHLKRFQLQNGLKDDAVVGKWTNRVLANSNMDRFYQAALSLEKWRWKKKYPNRYIRVNIPAYSLVFVDSNEVKRKHRVVVGAYATQTPEFQATMKRLVTNPFWHVPYSISSTEILSGAQKDSNYFNKRGYKIFKGGEQIPSSSVDWAAIKENNFPYRVRQDGGRGNSLGKIKFLFPNEHSVFIHDTPSKRLFGNDVRAYSHGCVRLHEPFELGKSILALDNQKIVPDSLDALVNRGVQKVIELNEPFEVFIEYFTASGDSSGTIVFHPDVYGRDEKYLINTFKIFQP